MPSFAAGWYLSAGLQKVDLDDVVLDMIFMFKSWSEVCSEIFCAQTVFNMIPFSMQ